MSQLDRCPVSRTQRTDSVQEDDGGADCERLALLIAKGEAPFPSHLSAPAAVALATAVRRLRRQRLVRFIAQLIARSIVRDLHRDAGP